MTGIITVSAQAAAASVVMDRRRVNARSHGPREELSAAFRSCTGRR